MRRRRRTREPREFASAPNAEPRGRRLALSAPPPLPPAIPAPGPCTRSPCVARWHDRLSLADFNGPEAPAAVIPTHSTGEASAEFGASSSEDKWGATRGAGETDATGPRSTGGPPPSRGDTDSNWRNSQEPVPTLDRGDRSGGATADANWRGTESGVADGDSDWRSSQATPSGGPEPAQPERAHAGSNRGQADGDGDWRASQAATSAPSEGPPAEPERAHAGANKGDAERNEWSRSGPIVTAPEPTAQAEPTENWRGTARGEADRNEWSRSGPIAAAPERAPAAAPGDRNEWSRSGPMATAPERTAAAPGDRNEWSRSGPMAAAPERAAAPTSGPWRRSGAAPTSQRAYAPPAKTACMFFARGACQRDDVRPPPLPRPPFLACTAKLPCVFVAVVPIQP